MTEKTSHYNEPEGPTSNMSRFRPPLLQRVDERSPGRPPGVSTPLRDAGTILSADVACARRSGRGVSIEMISRTTTPPRRLVAAALVLLLGPALWAPSEGRATSSPQPSSPPPSGADAPARPARRGGGARRLAPVRPPTLELSMRS